eukprot:TRINITY_DN11360_c0_g2_i1.p1 TRINITY_DN11360_c0_g2~~TRINITY_DN11360_c0_g2_i1.p1  ORF type:complete len:216 (-),score=-11.99 TRINITY_DN11360_c0_g2_i1:359-1006(-)
MQDLELKKIAQCLSKQRLSKYGNNLDRAVANYKWNLELSESFYPVLNALEVSLRNRLHQEIAILVNDPNWLSNKATRLVSRMHPEWILAIDLQIKKLFKQKKLDEGHLIAELVFGFWVSLLSGSFEKGQLLWPKLKKKVFPYAHNVSIKEIKIRLNAMRILRNRIFHYEPIWHYQDLIAQHNQIIEAIHWLEPAITNILLDVNRFHLAYANKPEL